MEGTELYKEIMAPRDGEVVWKDGYGRGVLVREGDIFNFYSRLNPDWGELVWSRQFPALLARVLFGEEGPGARDLRMMDAAQVVPVRRAGDGGAGIKKPGGWGGDRPGDGGLDTHILIIHT